VFTTQPVLVVPDLDKEIRVEVDASEYVTKGVLLMKCEDEKWRPVAFISKSLNKAERNYKIHDREMCKGTPPFPPLSTMTTLRSYLSLFTSDT